MKYYPCNTSEFSGIKPDLGLVDFYIEQEALKASIRSTEAELQQEERKQSSAISSLLEELLEKSEDRNTSPVDHTEVQMALQRASQLAMQGRKYQHMLHEVLNHYLIVDVERLKQDIGALIPENESNKNKVQGCKMRLGKLQKQYDDLVATCEERCFNRLPDAYIKVNVEKQKNLEQCVAAFVQKWRKVAGWFAEPVTIYGVSIASMPPDKRKVWTKAFEKLGIKYNIRPVYKPRLYGPKEAMNA